MKKLLISASFLLITSVHVQGACPNPDSTTSGSVGLITVTTGFVDPCVRFDNKFNTNMKIIAATMTTALNNLSTLATDTSTLNSNLITAINSTNTVFRNYTSTSDTRQNLFNGFMSTSDAQQTKFVNFNTTGDVKNDNFNAFQSTSDSLQTKGLNFGTTVGTRIDELQANLSTTSTDIDNFYTSVNSTRTDFRTYTSTADTRMNLFNSYMSTADTRMGTIGTDTGTLRNLLSISTSSLSIPIIASDEGTVLSTMTLINFVGAGVSATNTGSTITVTIAGGGGGGVGIAGIFVDTDPTKIGAKVNVSTISTALGSGLFWRTFGSSAVLNIESSVFYSTGMTSWWKFNESTGNKTFDTIVSTRFGWVFVSSNPYIRVATGSNNSYFWNNTGGTGTISLVDDGVFSSHAGANGQMSFCFTVFPTQTPQASMGYLAKMGASNYEYIVANNASCNGCSDCVCAAFYSAAGAGQASVRSSSAGAITANMPNSICVKWDASGGSIKMFCNGNDVSTVSGTVGGTSDNGLPLNIGTTSDDDTNPKINPSMSGIDNLIFWNRPITLKDAQIYHKAFAESWP